MRSIINEIKYCLIYCRVSSAKQAQEGESLEVQEKICRTIAQRNNFEIVKVFKEQYSGRKEERPVIEEIFAYLKKHPNQIKFLMIRAIDRFTRNGTFGYEILKQRLADYGVQLIDSNGIIQPSQNTLEHLGLGYGWSHIFPSETAELVSAQEGKNEINKVLTRMIGAEVVLVRDGYKVRQADDGYLNEKIYTDSGKRKIIQVADPERAKYYIKMFELRASGAYSDSQIVDYINAMGYRSRFQHLRSKDRTKIIGKRGGLVLTVKHLQKTIQRPIYCGINTEKWLTAPIKTQYKGLVSVQTFNKANKGKVYIEESKDGSINILKDYNPHQLKRMKDNPLFPFKEVVLCPMCSKPFLGSSPKGKSGKTFPTYHCCRDHKYYGVSKDTFEKSISDFVEHLTYKDENYLRSFEATLKNKFREKEKELGEFATQSGSTVIELEAEKKQMIDAYKRTTSKVIQDDLEEQIEKIHQRIKETQQQRNQLEVQEDDVHAFIGFVKKLMEHPEEYLVKQKDATLLRGFYGLVFDEFPTYQEIVNGTPKLSLPYKLSDEFKRGKSLSVK